MSADMVMEALIRTEMAKMSKVSLSDDIRRRDLVSRWLYLHGFLAHIFPANKSPVPGHLVERDSN
jgi:hypothetical protein